MSETQLKENAENLQKQELDISELKNEEVKQVVKTVMQEIEFSGPMPPPNILSGHEKILPGAADRILTMTETQSRHRQQMEKRMIEAEARDGLLGVLFGFALGGGCIIAAVIMVFVYPQAAGVISGAILGSSGVTSIAITSINRGKRTKDS